MNKLNNNSKTVKSLAYGYENLIMHLSPVKKAGRVLKSHESEVTRLVNKRLGRVVDAAALKKAARVNTCPHAGACSKYCLDQAGRGKFSNVQIGRAAKTLAYTLDKELFINELELEINRVWNRAFQRGFKLAVRLNGTSDCDFTELIDNMNIWNKSLRIEFYDYTKNMARFNRFLSGNLSSNYYLTFSYDKKNHAKTPDYEAILLTYLERGAKIAIIEADYEALCTKNNAFMNYKRIDGDKHDLRFKDQRVKGGAFVMLKFKK